MARRPGNYTGDRTCAGTIVDAYFLGRTAAFVLGDEAVVLVSPEGESRHKGFPRLKAYGRLPVLKAALVSHATKLLVANGVEVNTDAA